MEVLSVNRFAGFTRRFIAFIIDRFILWIGLSFVVSTALGVENNFGNYAYKIDMFNFSNLFDKQLLFTELLLLTYFVVCETSSWQATIGKRMMGLKVVTTQYQKMNPKEAILRYLSKYLSMAVLALGFIWIIFDDKKQGWHDKIANTFVIVS
jgi:uncharacterized RDD family membrane protein YckC